MPTPSNRAPQPSLLDGDVHLWWKPTATQDDMPRQRRARLDALLRGVLAGYADQDPEALRFGRESRGRPYLLGCQGPDFNLSDTVGGSVVAVTRGGRIGVDLERTDRRLPHRRLARRYFAPEESSLLEGLDDEAARIGFLRLWTAKEASCKSTGTGIYGWLVAWQFDPLSDSPRLLALPPEAGEAGRWHHLRVAPHAGYTAVLACDGFVPRVRKFVVDESVRG